jgi:predicted RNase H-like HicB family nuclease
MKYLVILEETPTGFSAYSPDVEGCIATGSSREEVEQHMREALEFHLDGLREEGYEIPPPRATATWVDTAA